MVVDTVLHNAKVCINGNLEDAGIAIDEGKIVKIAKGTNLPSASTRLNLKGLIVFPGMIDCHVHLRDQLLDYKEDFFTGTAAAAAGGVTSVVDMPNNKPVTMNICSLNERIRLAEKRAVVNVFFNSAFPKSLQEMAEIVNAGAVGFKVYLSNRIGGVDVDDNESLVKAFRASSVYKVPVLVHAEDPEIILNRRRELETAGMNDADSYVKAHPPEAEARSIQRIIELVKASGVHVHFCHISSALGMKSIMVAKKAGLPVSCEVTPHNLLLSSEVYKRFGFFALTDPPLRTRNDVLMLWNGIRKGFVDVIASDHAPHSLEEKDVDSVWEAKPGVPGLETTFSLLLTKVNEGILSLRDLTRLTAEKPANIFHIENRGYLQQGGWADLVVVDMKLEYEIDSTHFFSKAKYSPFDGICVKGKVLKTFVNGNLVMDEGEIFLK